jgi:uncharacterized membrane protein
MILLVRALVKLVKWALIAVAYVMLAVGKVVAFVVVLAFLGVRAGILHLRDGRDRGADEEHVHEYEPGYRSYGNSLDSFDADWQWERDMRLAQRRITEPGAGLRGVGNRGRLP